MKYLVNNLRKVIVVCLVIIGIGTWYYYTNKTPYTDPERADLVFIDSIGVR